MGTKFDSFVFCLLFLPSIIINICFYILWWTLDILFTNNKVSYPTTCVYHTIISYYFCELHYFENLAKNKQYLLPFAIKQLSLHLNHYVDCHRNTSSNTWEFLVCVVILIDSPLLSSQNRRFHLNRWYLLVELVYASRTGLPSVRFRGNSLQSLSAQNDEYTYMIYVVIDSSMKYIHIDLGRKKRINRIYYIVVNEFAFIGRWARIMLWESRIVGSSISWSDLWSCFSILSGIDDQWIVGELLLIDCI